VNLESRYRRLLAWYPWEHRRRYEEEMVAVLMAGARPGQRYPALRDVTNLLSAAVRYRLGRTARGLIDPQWTDAAAVVGLLAAILVLAARVHPLVRAGTWAVFSTLPASSVSPELLPFALAWTAVVAAALIGLRWPAAILAWIAVLGEVVRLGSQYATDPVPVVHGLWPLLLAILAAIGLSIPAAPRRAAAVLGRRRLLAITCAVVLLQARVIIEAARWGDPAWHYLAYSILGRAGLDSAGPFEVGAALIFLACMCRRCSRITGSDRDAPLDDGAGRLVGPYLEMAVVAGGPLAHVGQAAPLGRARGAAPVVGDGDRQPAGGGPYADADRAGPGMPGDIG
jgi:hypothetical protein